MIKENTKVCSKCGEVKLLSKFFNRKNTKDGHRKECIICCRKRDHQHYLKHKDKIKLRKKQHYLENKNQILLKAKQHHLEHKKEDNLRSFQYYSEHKPESKSWHQQYYRKNQNEINLKHKQYNLKHLKEKKLCNQRWYSKNKNKQKLYKLNPINKNRSNKLKRERNKNDPTVKIVNNVRSRNRSAFKSQGVKKTMHTIELLGCTALEFKSYIIRHFTTGMTEKNNKKKKWVQHHIIEFNDVDLHDIEQLKKVCHYTNIIPMWEDEHKELHAKKGFKRKNKTV